MTPICTYSFCVQKTLSRLPPDNKQARTILPCLFPLSPGDASTGYTCSMYTHTPHTHTARHTHSLSLSHTTSTVHRSPFLRLAAVLPWLPLLCRCCSSVAGPTNTCTLPCCSLKKRAEHGRSFVPRSNESDCSRNAARDEVACDGGDSSYPRRPPV